MDGDANGGEDEKREDGHVVKEEYYVGDVGDDAPIVRASLSPDKSMLALQRSGCDVQVCFTPVETRGSENEDGTDEKEVHGEENGGEIGDAEVDVPRLEAVARHEAWLSLKRRRRLDTVHELFWALCPKGRQTLVLCTSSGTECIVIDAASGTEDVVESRRLPGTRFAIFSASTGMLLIASGQYCNRFSAFQVRTGDDGGIVGGDSYDDGKILSRIAQFELPAPILLGETIKRHDVSVIRVGETTYISHHQHPNSSYSSFDAYADDAGTSPGGRVTANGTPASASKSPSSPASAQDSGSSTLALYSIHGRTSRSRGSVRRRFTLQLYSLSSVSVFVLDNVVCVYSIDNDVVVLYDLGVTAAIGSCDQVDTSSCGGSDANGKLTSAAKANERHLMMELAARVRTRSGYGAVVGEATTGRGGSGGGNNSKAAAAHVVYVEPMLAPLPIGDTITSTRRDRPISRQVFATQYMLDVTEQVGGDVGVGAATETASPSSSPSLTPLSCSRRAISIVKLELDLQGIVDSSVVDSEPAARAEVLDFLLRRRLGAPVPLVLSLLSRCLEQRDVELIPDVMDVVAVHVMRDCLCTEAESDSSEVDAAAILLGYFIDVSEGGYRRSSRGSSHYYHTDNKGSRDGGNCGGMREIAAVSSSSRASPTQVPDVLTLSDVIRGVLLPAMLDNSRNCPVFLLFAIQELRRAMDETLDSLMPPRAFSSSSSSSSPPHTQSTSTSKSLSSSISASLSSCSALQRETFIANTLPAGTRAFAVCVSALESLERFIAYGGREPMVIDYDDAGRGASVSHEATTSSSWAMTPEKTRGDRDVADITMTYSACGMPDTDFSSDSLAALVLLLRNAFPQSSSADVILQDPDLMYTSGREADVVTALLRHGRVAAALNFARAHRVGDVPVHAYLAAAVDSGDPLVATTVRRFCSLFVEGFEDRASSGGGGGSGDLSFSQSSSSSSSVDTDGGYASAVEKLRRVSIS